MDLFICINTYIPLRESPAHHSVMVSQILFGERFSVIESIGSWFRIETLFDHYRGWIDSSHNGFNIWNDKGPGVITSGEILCMKEDGSLMKISPGSELFRLTDDFSSFSIAEQTYHLKEAQVSHLIPHASVPETASQFMNSPYLWGGRTPAGIDCSGFVQIVYKIHGYALPRDAAQQADVGNTIDFISEAEPGDILFFSDNNDSITHTGILSEKGIIIHAAGKVRKDRVDHQGIWNDEKGCYTHRLRLIKRIS